MAMKETASKCFIALTLRNMAWKPLTLRNMAWKQRKQGEEQGDGFKEELTKGYYNNIIKELRFEDTQGLSDMFRMNYSTFQEVLMYIEHEITPNEVMGGHRAISPGERLTLTLRFLGTGETLLLDPTSWIGCTNGSNMLDPTF